MLRDDLLALTEDDLTTLTNRGTVRRALRELASGTPSCTFDEQQDGTLIATWSDGITCEFPLEGTLDDARCSSGTPGISRHVIRSVLAYKTHTAEQGFESPFEDDRPWDPGTISDDELEKQFGKSAIRKARSLFKQGILAEVVRSRKPLVQFLHEPCTLRFLVPNNLRYIYADCAQRLLPQYVSQAVWAFRELPPNVSAGLVSTQRDETTVPNDVLDEIDSRFVELCRHGIAGSSNVWRDSIVRLTRRCQSSGLIWPAEILNDLLIQIERYHEHDARFDANEAARFIGEAIVRADAIRSNTGEVPQPFIRGTESDEATEIRAARLIGLGCGVHVRRNSVELTTFQQDLDSGNVVAIHREFTDPERDSGNEPHDFALLAQTNIRRGVSLHSLASGQLLLKKAKRTPSNELKLPRGALSVHPQAYEWEKLRSPILAEGIEEISSRIELLPPSSLRPRRAAENLYVIPIETVEEVGFDTCSQCLSAVVRDAHGAIAVLSHPFLSRARQGFEALATVLHDNSNRVRFLSGTVRAEAGILHMKPLAVVYDSELQRRAVFPWIGEYNGERAEFLSDESIENVRSPISEGLSQLSDLIGSTITVGFDRGGSELARQWSDLALQLAQTGFVKLTATVERIAHALEGKRERIRWNSAPPSLDLLQLAALLELAHEYTAELDA